MVRRGIGGLQPANMVPAVDPACASSDFAGAIALQSARGENLSSNSASTAGDNLGDDTELNDRENALAHRGVLRGDQLWIGYNYTPDLVQLWAQLDNYNFWLRKYDAAAGTWLPPENVTQIEDKGINVRERDGASGALRRPPRGEERGGTAARGSSYPGAPACPTLRRSPSSRRAWLIMPRRT